MTRATKTSTSRKVSSKDGTPIAFTRTGDGPPVILVDGAFGHRAFGPNGPLVPLLSDRFTVFTYDRRGRGESGDTPPYAVEREVEDLEALINEAGGSASLYGISSGGALVLRAAAARNPAITKLAVFEAPYVVDDTRAPIPEDYYARMQELVAANRRGDVVKLFMRKGVGLPGPVVVMLRFTRAWSKLKALAHTAPYDAACLGLDDPETSKGLPTELLAAVDTPALVVGGEKSPQWMRNSVKALADALPNAQLRMLPKQTHIVKPKALAPALREFFANDRVASDQ